MLDRAKFLVISEIPRSPREDRGDRTEGGSALERCFSTRPFDIARAKAAKAVRPAGHGEKDGKGFVTED